MATHRTSYLDMTIDRFKTLIVASLLRLMSCLPLRILHAVAAFLGTLVYWLPTETRRVTLINLEQVFPAMPPRQRAHLARQSIRETLKAGLELGHMWYGSLDHVLGMIREVKGIEYVKAAQASGRGIIYAAPHRRSL